jgi:hypothetical protein
MGSLLTQEGLYMIYYRDMTFCSAVCDNKLCFRQFTKEVNEKAREWWSHDPDNAPIAFSDFSGTCPVYVTPKNWN